MKKQLTIMTITVLALFAMLLGLSCAPPPQNNANAGRNENASAINANTTAPGLAADACTATSDKPGEVKKQITADIMAKPKLKHLFDRHLFKLGVFPGSAPGSLHLYFTGKLAGPDSLGDLAALVKKVFKKSCVEKVFFATEGTIPLNATAATLASGDFFEWWVGCEDPNVPCTGGECKPPAECPVPTPNPGGANTNMNTNSGPTTNRP